MGQVGTLSRAADRPVMSLELWRIYEQAIDAIYQQTALVVGYDCEATVRLTRCHQPRVSPKPITST